ncbi:MAG: helix-turn-helix transcriptional regulator [Aeriscardovia sp.]|nr:helix-turn-helix transcriptional regulator [Aeriscardovia sp.]MBR3243840.1 helix-turn-helix transcriptional regulator [Parasporobacterium sp.]MBR3359808.1 helix-turn-helix transcriptional regulator [Lachnospiraceae bacterium]
MNKDNNRQIEKEILSSIVDQSEKAKSREWLSADFGEREKQLRMMHKYSQQDVAERIGTSISTISRLENGTNRSIEFELIGRLADLYQVSTDFLLGKIRTSERMYFTLRDIGLSPEAGLALYSGKADAPTVNKLLEDKKFQGLTYAIKDYLSYTPGKDGKPIQLLIEVCSDSKVRQIADYNMTNQPERICSFAGKMHGYYERGSVDALGDGLKTAVKEIRENNESFIRDGVKLTVEMLRMIKEVFPACRKDQSDEFNTPEYITSRILSLFAPDGKLTETSREFLAYFRNSLISMDLDDDEYTDDNGI